jgi:MFS family permease
MGFVLSGTQLGPGFGPFVAGIIITYQSWRVIFWLQAGLGGLGILLIMIFLPETIRQRKLDDIRLIKGKNVHFVPINPLRPIALFRYPNLLLTVPSPASTLFGPTNDLRELQVERSYSACILFLLL